MGVVVAHSSAVQSTQTVPPVFVLLFFLFVSLWGAVPTDAVASTGKQPHSRRREARFQKHMHRASARARCSQRLGRVRIYTNTRPAGGPGVEKPTEKRPPDPGRTGVGVDPRGPRYAAVHAVRDDTGVRDPAGRCERRRSKTLWFFVAEPGGRTTRAK